MTTSDLGSFAGSLFDPVTRIRVPSERTNLVLDDHSHEEYPPTDVDSEVSSFLPVSPAIRRLFVLEVDMAPASYEARRMLKKINQDGSFPCSQRHCYDVLPTREAYTCHVHIHLIHEG